MIYFCISFNYTCNVFVTFRSFYRFGYGLTRAEVLDVASDYGRSLGKIKATAPNLSLGWFRRFMRRHKLLTLSKARALDAYRAKACSKDNISNYLGNLKATIEKYNLNDRPHRIFNVDEKGLTSTYTAPNVVHRRGEKPAEVMPPRSHLTTLIAAGNALGTQIPPFFIFAGKKLHEKYFEGSSTGTDGCVSDNGWSHTPIFTKYLKKHFLKNIPTPTEEDPVLIIYDGHKSHVSFDLIEWARERHIILFVLPAHTSHFTQPLDVSCFRPLESIFSKKKHHLMKGHRGGALTHQEVCKLASHSYTEALKPANLQSGFRAAGIYPVPKDNPLSIFPESIFSPSAPFQQEAEPGETRLSQIETQEFAPREQQTEEDEGELRRETEEQNEDREDEESECEDVHTCGRCKESFRSVERFVEHKDECRKRRRQDELGSFFVERETVLDQKKMKKNPRNDVGSIVGGKEVTSDPVTEALRQHTAKKRKRFVPPPPAARPSDSASSSSDIPIPAAATQDTSESTETDVGEDVSAVPVNYSCPKLQLVIQKLSSGGSAQSVVIGYI